VSEGGRLLAHLPAESVVGAELRIGTALRDQSPEKFLETEQYGDGKAEAKMRREEEQSGTASTAEDEKVGEGLLKSSPDQALMASSPPRRNYWRTSLLWVSSVLSLAAWR